MDPPNSPGGKNLANTAIPPGSIVCPRTTVVPTNTAGPYSRRLRPPNFPDLASQSRNLDRPSISDTVSLGTGLMDIGSSARSDTTGSFGHWPHAPNNPDLASQSRNPDLPHGFDRADWARASTATNNTTRPRTTAVSFSHWLHAPETTSIVPEAPNPHRSAQSFIESLPPSLRDRYVRRLARDRTHVGNGQSTVNDAGTPDPVSQSRNPYRPDPRNIDIILPSWRVVGVQLQARDRPHAGNGQTTVNSPNTYQNPHTQHADRHTRASAAQHMKAEMVLESLPVLSLADLAKDSRECVICLEPYQTSPHHLKQEIPIRLPCSHIFGKNCLLHWLKSPPENYNNNSCPICRTILFERDVSPFEDWYQGDRDAFGQIPELSRSSATDMEGIERRARTDSEHLAALARSTVDMEGFERRARTRSDHLDSLVRRANDADDRLIEGLERRGDTARAQEVRARRDQRRWM